MKYREKIIHIALGKYDILRDGNLELLLSLDSCLLVVIAGMLVSNEH